MSANPLRDLPSVDAVLREQDAEELLDAHGRQATADAVRAVLQRARELGTPLAAAEVVAGAADLLSRPPSLRRVINATGVIVHTNLGRAPLARRGDRPDRRRRRGYSTSSTTWTPAGAARATST